MPRAEFTCTVTVKSLPDQTDTGRGRWGYAYTVTIRNTGEIAAQLIARRWLIRDSQGHQQEVRGLAVVGHQPMLKPGEQFEYTSWAQIGTPTGSMRGTFFCFTEDAHPFEADIPEFALAGPSMLH